MPERIMVRPGEGRRVRLDDGRRLTPANTPATGESVEWSIYIQRRINCGDLIVVNPPPPSAVINFGKAPAPAPETSK
jgi:hypothetical protein